MPPAQPMRSVLLVDDEPAALEYMALSLESRFRTLTASDGLDALQRVEADAEAEIALVVTDIRMPGMNGLELGERLAELRPDLPVLYVSGYAELSLQSGVEDTHRFFAKPFRPEALLDRVTEMVASERHPG
jgi:CheY-like chemotaxis protein